MSEDMEKRIQALERGQDRATSALERLSQDISEIKQMLQQALTLSSRVSAVENELKAVWKKLDKCSDMKEEFAILCSEHEVCRPRVDELYEQKNVMMHKIDSMEKTTNAATSFISGRLGSLMDKFLPIVLIAGIAFYVGKVLGK